MILTTHSPYVLEELPLEARACILQGSEGRQIIYGVSPEFAMTKMDDVPHHECDLYVEDDHAARMLVEILAASSPDLVERCQVVPCGAALGRAGSRPNGGERSVQAPDVRVPRRGQGPRPRMPRCSPATTLPSASSLRRFNL